MAVRVALRLQEAYLARLVDTDKTVRHRSSAHGVDCRRQAAIGTVFKANRHRQARRHLAVGLRFCGTRTNRRPAEQIAQVLRAVRVQRFGCQRQPHADQLHQKATRNLQACFHIKRAIHVRIVNQPFLKIDAHHQIEAIADLLR